MSAPPPKLGYPPHPASLIFPALDPRSYRELVDDIAEHGLRIPIALYDGQILDGRHRERACREAGVEPHYITITGTNPWAYARSCNLARRHLTKQERAEIVVRSMAESGELDKIHAESTSTQRQGKAKPTPPAIDGGKVGRAALMVAKEAEVSRRTAERALAAQQKKERAEAKKAAKAAQRAAREKTRQERKDAKEATRRAKEAAKHGDVVAGIYAVASTRVASIRRILYDKAQREVHEAVRAIAAAEADAVVSHSPTYAPIFRAAMELHTVQHGSAAAPDLRTVSKRLEDLETALKAIEPEEVCPNCRGQRRCPGAKCCCWVKGGGCACKGWCGHCAGLGFLLHRDRQAAKDRWEGRPR